jgi:telomerase protein component 1
MVQVWKVIRVFISSTFRDMGAERDHLVRFVFPELRERCARRRLHLVDVDLRWGVTEEEAETGKVLEICLDEIERCRPYFIGILGERFGHIPSNYDVPAGVAYDWLRKIQPGHSITALEIYHGVLQNPEMAAHAFFYFRDPTFIDDVPVTARGPFLSEGEESARKLVILKDSIRGRFPVFDNYPCSFQGLSATGNALLGDLDQFGKHVLEDLWTAISQEHSLDSVTPDELAVERAAHESFIENRTQHFVGRTGLLEALTRFADTDEGRILAVVGAAGIGKSALISTFVRQYAASHPDVFVLPHFFGINPSATEIRTTLRRICRELATHYGTNTEISEDYNHVRKTFAELLEETGKNGKTLLLLDALDQLDPDHGARLLNWLRTCCPTLSA